MENKSDFNQNEPMNAKRLKKLEQSNPLEITDILIQLKTLKPTLRQDYGVSKIGIFGSFARNQTHPKSDIDIVVEMEPDLLKRSRLKLFLEKHFGQQVDVIRYWQGMNPYLKSQIDRDAYYA
jgi:predicted nucleotidyltransferase